MRAYLSSGGSNITGYDYGDDYIQIEFVNGEVYTYTYESAGKENVEEMKGLADNGNGLNSYINSYCKYDYSGKN